MYNTLRLEVKKSVVDNFNLYLEKIKQDISNGNCESFWKFAKDNNSVKHTPDIMKLNEREMDSPEEIAEAFREYFMSVYNNETITNESVRLTNEVSPCTNNIFIRHIDTEEVFKAIKSIKTKRSVGPDGIPAYIVKGCADIITPTLSHLFNVSLKTGVFPNKWKTAKVCPIFKNGDRNDVKNYRPVSILSIFSKIFECIIYKHVKFQLKCQMSEFQHGFLANKSVATNLTNFSDYVITMMDSGSQVDAIYLDFQKAFDSVNHCLLLNKLQSIGVSGSLFYLLSSFLSERKQYVVHKNATSSDYLALSGVPQGSNLGPLLFLIFINDLPQCLRNTKCLMFADDIKIYRKVDNLTECLQVQNDLHNIFMWSKNNYLHFNINKCSVMTYSRRINVLTFNYSMDEVVIERKSELKDLGIIFDCKMAFVNHILYISMSACKLLGFLYRMSKYFRNECVLKLLYFSLVRSKLEYCSVIWNPYTKKYSEIIEKIQKRFLRHMYYIRYRVYPIMENHIKYDNLLEMFHVHKLFDRRILNDLLFLHDVINKGECGPLLNRFNFHVPTKMGRNIMTFYVMKVNSEYCKNSPINRLCTTFNRYCNDINLYQDRNKFLKEIIEKIIILR
jgi:hypothetical protein